MLARYRKICCRRRVPSPARAFFTQLSRRTRDISPREAIFAQALSIDFAWTNSRGKLRDFLLAEIKGLNKLDCDDKRAFGSIDGVLGIKLFRDSLNCC